MTIASIDIGTNTILLLIAELLDDGTLRVIRDRHEIARLGVDVDANRMLRHDAMERAAAFLRQYKEDAARCGATAIVAVGTSALRDAGNGRAFCAHIAETVGITIEILPGEEEAQWTYRGGIAEFAGAAEKYSVLDIGGGSTEVVVGSADAIVAKHSFDIGCVRLTERFLRSAPPSEEDLAQAHAFARTMLQPVTSMGVASTFPVAVAGTVTTMAALHQRLAQYEPQRVSGFVLDRTIVGSIFIALKAMTHDEIRALPQVAQGRADIILAGIIIAETYMDLTGLDRLVVSDRGLRYGILYREFEARRR